MWPSGPSKWRSQEWWWLTHRAEGGDTIKDIPSMWCSGMASLGGPLHHPSLQLPVSELWGGAAWHRWMSQLTLYSGCLCIMAKHGNKCGAQPTVSIPVVGPSVWVWNAGNYRNPVTSLTSSVALTSSIKVLAKHCEWTPDSWRVMSTTWQICQVDTLCNSSKAHPQVSTEESIALCSGSMENSIRCPDRGPLHCVVIIITTLSCPRVFAIAQVTHSKG